MSRKKVWSKPELVILVRSKPEEVLTLDCKQNVSGMGPTATATHCNELVGGSRCNNCFAQTSGS